MMSEASSNVGSSRLQNPSTASIPSSSRHMSLDFIAPGATTVSQTPATSQSSFVPLETSLLNRPTLPSLAQYCRELATLENRSPCGRLHSPTPAKHTRERSLLVSPTMIGIGSVRRPHVHTHLYHPYTVACPSPPSSTQSTYSRSSKSRSLSPQFSLSDGNPRTQSTEKGGIQTAVPTVPALASTRSPSTAFDASSYRGERVGYDLEEKFALVWLRIKTERGWKHIKHGIDLLFPPGQVRRTTAPLGNNKTLPRNYPERSIGGLECRYYRVREKAGMKKVRDGRKQTADTETEALDCMERELVEHWVETIGDSTLRSFNLEQRQGEEDESWWARVGRVYQGESGFWTQLMAVGDVVRAQD